eukprot:10122346-Alexandrium_andersonii.AAC.1
MWARAVEQSGGRPETAGGAAHCLTRGPGGRSSHLCEDTRCLTDGALHRCTIKLHSRYSVIPWS